MKDFFIKNNISFLIFIFLSLTYFLTAKGYIEAGDTLFSLRTAKAIIENHSLSIKAADEEKRYYYKTADGKIYSQYGLGLAFLFIPFVIIGKILAISLNLPEERLISFILSFYNIFFGAGACVAIFYLIRFFKASNIISLTVALILGLTTMCWRYSVSDLSEVTQMFFLILAIYCILKNTSKSMLLGSFAYSFLILLKIVNITYLSFFILYIFFRNKQEKKFQIQYISYFIFSILISCILIFYLNFARFGNIFETGYADKLRFHLSGIANTVKLIFSFEKGIFIYNPIILLGILGYAEFIKRYYRESILFSGIIVFNLCISAMWHWWLGGLCWGPRLLVPVIALWLFPIFLLLN